MSEITWYPINHAGSLPADEVIQKWSNVTDVSVSSTYVRFTDHNQHDVWLVGGSIKIVKS